MHLTLITFKLSQDPDFSGQTDWRTDWRMDWQTEGKPIDLSSVNTGRGLISVLDRQTYV